MVASSVKTPEIKLEHSDARGEIYSVQLPGDRELMLLYSKEGSLRGGHAHDVDELVVVLTGSMIYHKRDEAGNAWVENVKEGDASYNPAGRIHMGEFSEDSWVLEWKLGTTKGTWNNIDYTPWRERVQENIKELA